MLNQQIFQNIYFECDQLKHTIQKALVNQRLNYYDKLPHWAEKYATILVAGIPRYYHHLSYGEYYSSENFFPSWTALHAQINDQSERISVQQLAVPSLSLEELFGHDQSEIPRTTSKPIVSSDEHSRPITHFIPETITSLENSYTIHDLIIQRSAQGCIRGGVIVYRAEGSREFLLPLYIATVPTPRTDIQLTHYMPGISLAAQCLYFEDLLEKHPKATVLYCDDLRVAQALNNAFADSKQIPQGTYVAVAHYGGSRRLAKIDMSPLVSREVVYIPSGNRDSYAAASLYHKHLLEYEVKNVSVLPELVYAYPVDIDQAAATAIADKFERHLLQSFHAVPDMESATIKNTLSRAYSFVKYQEWAVSMGILNTDQNQVPEVKTVLSLKDILASPVAVVKDKPFNLAAMESPILIHGETNTAKSLLMLSASLGISSGHPILMFEAHKACNVLVIDGETSKPSLAERLQRIVSAYPNLECSNFHFRSLRAETNDHNLNLTTTYWQEQIEQSIQEQRSEVVVFDNLVSLVPGIKDSSKAWDNVFSWLLQMEKSFGIKVIVLHHSNIQGKPTGSKNIENMCQTILRLEGRSNVLELPTTPLTQEAEFIENHQNSAGALIRITFTKCKSHPDKEHKPWLAFLAYNTGMATSAPQWEVLEVTASNISTHAVEPLDDNLLPEEKEVMLKLAKPGKYFTCNDVRALLTCQSTKAQGILKNLMNQQLINRTGKCKSIKYSKRS